MNWTYTFRRWTLDDAPGVQVRKQGDNHCAIWVNGNKVDVRKFSNEAKSAAEAIAVKMGLVQP